MTISVYRLEHHETGKGPFTSCNIPNSIMNELCDIIRPYNDAKTELAIQQEEVCGTEEAMELGMWFGCTFKRLLALGYQILVYTLPVESVRKGAEQVVFKKTLAVAKKELTYDEWRKIRW